MTRRVISPTLTRWAYCDRLVRILLSVSIGVFSILWHFPAESSPPLWSSHFTSTKWRLDFNCKELESCWSPKDAVISIGALVFSITSLLSTLLQCFPNRNIEQVVGCRSNNSRNPLSPMQGLIGSVLLGVAEHAWHMFAGMFILRLMEHPGGEIIWTPGRSVFFWVFLVEALWTPHRSPLGVHLYVPSCLFMIFVGLLTEKLWSFSRQSAAGSSPSGHSVAINLLLGCVASTAFAYLIVRCFSLVRDFFAAAIRVRVARIRGIIKIDTDISYSQGTTSRWRHTLDVISPGPAHARNKSGEDQGAEAPLLKEGGAQKEKKRTLLLPVVIFWHGGAYFFGSRRQARNVGATWVQYGDLICVMPNYSLRPSNAWPTMGEDAADAVGWVKKNIKEYGGDPDCIFLAGHSAGGHLAMNTALHNTRLKERAGIDKLTSLRGLIAVSSGRAVVQKTSGLFPTEAARIDGSLGTYTDEMERKQKQQQSQGDRQQTQTEEGDWYCPPTLFLLSHLEAYSCHQRTKECFKKLTAAGVSTQLEYFPLHSHISEACLSGCPEDFMCHHIVRFVSTHSTRVISDLVPPKSKNINDAVIHVSSTVDQE